jgi:GNAT superfamily N-acetyltransferase
MEALAPGPLLDGLPDVEEVTDPGEDFWALQREAFGEFEVTDPEAIGQLIAWERDLLMPFGKRWFAVRLGGEMAGFGALLVRDHVAYVDNVVTLPHARRRGVASAIVMRMREEAARADAERVFLLADRPDPIRLYERLGFRKAEEIASSLRQL